MKLHVEGMTCGHCSRAITQAIQRLDAQAGVSVDLAAGEVTITGCSLPIASIADAIRQEGYTVNP